VELSLIWLNKVFLIQKATQINPFNTELFAWIDAGICIYRNHHPPLRPFDFDKIAKLPRNKFIFCSTEYNCFIPDLVMDNNIYHYLSGNFIIDINMINIFCLIYSEFLEKNVPKKMLCYSSEQVIFTHMYKSFGDNMFHKYGDGYGSIINNLYTKKDGDSLIKTDWFKEQLIYHH
jgi:hypothetical protein